MGIVTLPLVEEVAAFIQLINLALTFVFIVCVLLYAI